MLAKKTAEQLEISKLLCMCTYGILKSLLLGKDLEVLKDQLSANTSEDFSTDTFKEVRGGVVFHPYSSLELADLIHLLPIFFSNIMFTHTNTPSTQENIATFTQLLNEASTTSQDFKYPVWTYKARKMHYALYMLSHKNQKRDIFTITQEENSQR